MVLPKVRHHFLELPLAGDGACDAGRLQLSDDLTTRILLLTQLHQHRAVIGSHSFGRVGAIAFDDAALLLLLSVLPEQIVLILIERRVSGGEHVQRIVVDFSGMKLLVDPVVESNGAHFLRITRPSAEGQPIESLNDLLIGGQLTDVGPRYNGFLRSFRTGFLRG